MAKINKARFWTAVLYPENMVEDWETLIGDIVQYPYAYCKHDADTDSTSKHRKDHVHLILAFPNTTTYRHAMGVFELLSAEGKKALNTCEAVIGIRNVYDYLIHDTETCRKQGKHQYEPSARVTGNNFDIGAYEQLSTTEKNAMFVELSREIEEQNFCNYADFFIFALDEYVSQNANYIEVLKANSGHFERMTRGNFLRSQHHENANFGKKHHENTTQNTTLCCPKCGSVKFAKDGKTAGGTPRFKCKDCGKRFTE